MPAGGDTTIYTETLEGTRAIQQLGRQQFTDGYWRAGIAARAQRGNVEVLAQQWLGHNSNADGFGSPISSSGGFARFRYFLGAHAFVAARYDTAANQVALRDWVVYAEALLFRHTRFLIESKHTWPPKQTTLEGAMTIALPWPWGLCGAGPNGFGNASELRGTISTMRVLVVEDDHEIAAGIRTMLERQSSPSAWRATARAGSSTSYAPPTTWRWSTSCCPGATGSRCAGGRAQGVSTQVLMLTARDAIEDRVRGLDAGADDYLVKPFVFDELAARLRALTRRAPLPPRATVAVGDLLVNRTARAAAVRGRALALGSTEFRLLEFLALNAGITLSRAQILEAVGATTSKGPATSSMCTSANCVGSSPPPAPSGSSRRCGHRLYINRVVARLCASYIAVFLIVLLAISAVAYAVIAASYRSQLQPALGTPVADAAFAAAMRHVVGTDRGVRRAARADRGGPLRTCWRGCRSRRSRKRDNAKRVAADAAHELRTPLASIAATAQAAALDATGPAHDAFARIAATALDASALVGDLLTLMRIEAMPAAAANRSTSRRSCAPWPMSSRCAPGSAASPSNSTLGARSSRARRSACAKRCAICSKTRCATRAGASVRGRAWPGARPCSTSRTTGKGCRRRPRARVFERFFKAREDSGGSGLGLAICRWIARAHDGDIALEGGSRFVVRIPAVV